MLKLKEKNIDESISIKDKGICLESNCKSPAIIDYNGHSYWVCQSHYDSLNDEFDEDYD